MTINRNLLVSPNNERPDKKAGPVKRDPAVFRSVLEEYSRPPAAGAEKGDALSLDEVTAWRKIAALSGQSRLQGAKNGDVSDFLELVEKADYLLRGITLPGDGEDAPLPADASPDPARDTVQLRRRYRADDISPDSLYALFRELTAMGALSGEDVRNTQLSVVLGGENALSYLREDVQFKEIETIPETRAQERLTHMIRNEQLVFRHVHDRYGQRCNKVQELSLSHGRVLDALNKL